MDSPSYVMGVPMVGLFVLLLSLAFSILSQLFLSLLVLLLLLLVSFWLLVLLLLLLLITLVLGSIGLQFLKMWYGESKSTLHFLELSSESNDFLLISKLDHSSTFHIHLVVVICHHMN